MATKKSSSKPTLAAVARPAVNQFNEVPQGFDAVDARGTLEDAINTLEWISILIGQVEDQLEDVNLYGRVFARYAHELCARHGRRLDRLFSELHPNGARVGTFDDDCYTFVEPGEVANG